MIPIYFPYTFIPDSVADAFAACFGQFVIYQPVLENISEQMQQWINRGVMNVRIPVSGNENELQSAINSYQTWADLHGAGSCEKAATLRTRMDSMPLFSELSFAKIAGDIKEKIRGKANSQIPDPVLAARVFLYFAQEFDRQNHELALNLQRCNQQEAEIIQQLKVEDDPLAAEFRRAPKKPLDPFADYMISDRLESWTRIFCQDPEVTGLFVTHSRAIFEHVLTPAATAVKVMHLESIPLAQAQYGKLESWQKKLGLCLLELIEHKSTGFSENSIAHLELPAAENTVSLSVYQVADQTPHDFFTHRTGISCPAVVGADSKRTVNNTLIVLVQGALNI